ncbi:MAG: arginine--tRNA ligase [candidate division Zixibacteria bacterium]|nr:arginine--tRNA ligase [candidate division Zixibacteria bacterium]
MALEIYKEAFAIAAAAAFRESYPDIHREVGDAEVFQRQFVYAALEKPKDPRMGRFALPVFKFAKLLKESPPAIVGRVAPVIDRHLRAMTPPSPVHCTGTGAFLNAGIDSASLLKQALGAILDSAVAYGASSIGSGKTVLVEYSSPNIAKPFGVGHLRSTVIGNSLRRIFKKLGYNVVGINYPGDWGTQFGKMIVAYRLWSTPETLRGDVVANLLELYVRFHTEAEKHPELEDQARAAFKSLESAEPEAVRLWEEFKQISHAEFDRIYGILGVEFDLVYGESFLNDKMEAVISRLEKDGLTSMSRGALVVELDDPNLPPALLKKQDGATLYLTRDLAGAFWRWAEYRFDLSLYVVGSSQADHFRQMLKVLELLEQKEQLPDMERLSSRIKHVDFGWIKFGDKSMSTRRGNIIILEDVLDRAVALVKQRIMEKNPDLAEIDKTASIIGVGAVIFTQLSARRQRDVNFVWEDVLNFDGETGPYLQYTHARLCSLERNYNKPVGSDIDFSLLDHEEEIRVVEALLEFPAIVADAAAQYEPYYVSSYLLRLAAAFNKVYQRKDEAGRIDKIISDNAELSAARMALVKAVRTVLKEGLYLLGLGAPEEM